MIYDKKRNTQHFIINLTVPDFYDALKIINEKHKNNFPYVHINVSEAKGKLEYLFDKNSILLNENGVIKAIQWDSIKCLEVLVNEI